MKTLSVSQAAQLIKEQKKILILTHRNPDGDTLGCAFALMRAARAFGIETKVFCCDKIPEKYGYMFCPEDLSEANGGDAYIIAVDIADIKLTGSEYSDKFAGRVGLCIDHHISNTGFSENLVLRDCAAACELILDIIKAMGAEIDKKIADCLYTGISTDTGCFRFSNTTENTHSAAAQLIKAGADHCMINRVMFETKTMGCLMLEAAALNSIELLFDGRCAVMTVTREMMERSGTSESDCDGIASIPRKIDGVLVGATLRERGDGTFKVSLRSHAPVDCAEICSALGGGGHARAAGCEMRTDFFEEDRKKLLESIKKELDKI